MIAVARGGTEFCVKILFGMYEPAMHTKIQVLINKVRDAIHTHFVTLIGNWTIVVGWVKHRADKRGKVGKIKS